MATRGPEIILTPEERNVFGQLFKAADEKGEGLVTGNRAVSFFGKSGLPSTTLAQAHSENKGFLTPQTFSIAIKLIAQAQNGQAPDRSLINKESPLPHFQDITLGPFNKGTANNHNNTFITNEDRDKYKRLFFSLDPRSGLIETSGEKAKAIWVRSKLSAEKLGQIWYLADTKNRGHLDLTEFIIAMYFVHNSMNNNIQTLPQTLPPGLYEEATVAAGGGSSNDLDLPTSPAFSPRTIATTTSPSPYSTGSPRFKPQQQQTSLLISRESSETASSFFDGGIANASEDAWDISPQDKANFDAHFSKLDGSNRGFITGKDLANITKSGRLTRDEFAVAMHLIHKKRAGGVLPVTLPPSLIPPSIRPTLTNAFSNLQRTDSTRPLTSTTNSSDPFFDLQYPTSTTNNSTVLQASPEVDLLSIGQDIKTEIALETGEIRNLESQITQLNNASTGLKARRNDLESNLTSLTAKKHDIKLRLTQLKSIYDAEVKIVQEIEANYRKEHEATEQVRAELALAERSLATMQLEKDQLQSGILKDREETVSLKKQVRLTEEETLTIKAQIEKLKKDSRQQKGLLAINRKQLASVKVEQEKSTTTLQKLQDEVANQQQVASDPFANLQSTSRGISEELRESGSQPTSQVHGQMSSISSISDLGIKRTISNASLDSISTQSVSSSRSVNLAQTNYEGATSIDKPASVATSKSSEFESIFGEQPENSNASEISTKSNPFAKTFDNVNLVSNGDNQITSQISPSPVQANLAQHEEKKLDPFGGLNGEEDLAVPAQQTNIDTEKQEDSLPGNDPFDSFKSIAGNNKLDAAFAFGAPPPETLTPDTFAAEFPTLEELEKSLAGDVSLGFEDNFTTGFSEKSKPISEDKKLKDTVDNDISSKTGDEKPLNSNQGLPGIDFEKLEKFDKTEKEENPESKDILSFEKIGANESEEFKISSFNSSAKPITNDLATALNTDKDSFHDLFASEGTTDPFTVQPISATSNIGSLDLLNKDDDTFQNIVKTKDQTDNTQTTATGSNAPIASIDDFDAAFADLSEAKVNTSVASIDKFDDAFDSAFAGLSEAKVVNAPIDFDATTFDENFDEDFNPTFDTPAITHVKTTNNSIGSQKNSTNFNSSIDLNKAFDDSFGDFDPFAANNTTTSTTLNTSKPNLDAAFGGSFGSTTTKSETKNEFGFEDTFTGLSKSSLPPPVPPKGNDPSLLDSGGGSTEVSHSILDSPLSSLPSAAIPPPVLRSREPNDDNDSEQRAQTVLEREVDADLTKKIITSSNL
ncbi:11960_t:CDS:10 [Ambispora gerdemannii]|uniref:11960_t:CDS:1 n=1 Tax=Ambispora gerdemannii TaxID=144530 RepID=A0A9N8WIL0_9GLOM|nr:11960_t:CDS:10 [Ambispora gerdemannii]